MPAVYLSLGSNVEPERNIRSCMLTLEKNFDGVVSSKVYQTPAVGFKGDDFLNSVVRFETSLGVEELRSLLRETEHLHGRKRSKHEKFNSRTLDIDLLLYGELIRHEAHYQLPHGDILKYAFVLYPLSEIAPALIHPVLGKTILSLTQELSLDKQQMAEVQLVS